MKKNYKFFVAILLFISFISLLGCGDVKIQKYDYILNDINGDLQKTVYMEVQKSNKSEFIAEIYGEILNDENDIFEIERKVYTFEQLGGNIWVTDLSIKKDEDTSTVRLFGRRAIIGKTLKTETISEYNLVGEVGENYGAVNWFSCFKYEYYK